MRAVQINREHRKSETAGEHEQRARGTAHAPNNSLSPIFHEGSLAFRLAAPSSYTNLPAPGVLQTKLNVSQPEDKYEQEADRVADQVMRMPDPAFRLQRKCGCTGASGETCEECAGKPVQLQRHATSTAETEAPSIVHDVLNSQGQQLNTSTRSFFEPRFGHDFSQVR